MMIAEFDRMAGDLDREIKTEQEQKAGISIPRISPIRPMPRPRRSAATTSASAHELQGPARRGKAELGEAFEELKKVEPADERDQARERAEVDAREQAALDAIGIMRTSARA